MLQWTWECRYLFDILFSFSSDMYLEVELLDDMAILFLIYIVLHSGCPNLSFSQQCTSIPFSPHPHQHLLSLIILTTDILTAVRRYLTVVFICISLMISSVEHLCMYLLAICMSSLEKFVAHFFLLAFACSWVICVLMYFGYQSLIRGGKCFNPFYRLPFHLSIVSFAVQKT